jgi:hypothetical protein
MARSYKSVDARTPEKSPRKTAAPVAVPAAAPQVVPGVEKMVIKDQPAADRTFQPGDLVSFRSNSRGIVLAVNGNGVQVDFGLGSGWYMQQSLTLIKAASQE